MKYASKFKSGSAAISSADVLAKAETNDCVVKAFMNAAQITYTEAHGIVATAFDRKPGQGTYAFVRKMQTCIAEGRQLVPGRIIQLLGTNYGCDYTHAEAAACGKLINPRYPKGRGLFAPYTVGKFLQQHPAGAYILVVKGHALAIRDGIMYDNPDQLDRLFATTGRDQRRVHAAFKIV